MSSLLFFAMSSFLVTAKAGEKPRETDPHSYARPWEVAVKHAHLKLKVDFKTQTLRGEVTLDLERKTAAPELRLDTRDLAIGAVTDARTGRPLAHRYGQADPNFGRELIIELAPDTRQVTVAYETSPQAHAVQWLAPAQTAGKKQPFLFTQSQSIHARSWIPLQDTPEARITYSAEIEVPPGLLALMSAENPQTKSADGRYVFRMPQPVPPYLMALAVGDLEFRAIGPRTGVYAEPSELAAAHWELANMEKILAAGEKIAGMPYAWDRYDTLILPPSFPFGGMENPRLTFATPTVITGDRSQEALHAHEASHSWTGNLVTNKNADHFWLNEGFTVYLERRIIEELYGRDFAETQATVALQDLRETIAATEPKYTKLRTDLAGVDPDEVYSVVPYEKGYLYLRHIEEVVGRPRFEEFLRAYIRHFRFQSIGTDEYLAFLEENLIRGDAELRRRIDSEAWIDGPGLPAGVPEIRSRALESVERLLAEGRARGRFDFAAIREFGTFEWVHFIARLPPDLPAAQLEELDRTFALSAGRNAEIVAEWLRYGIGKQHAPALDRVRSFLGQVGRGKFVKPLYRALEAAGQKELAREIFAAASPGYHNIIRTVVSRAHPYLACERALE